MQGFRSRVTSRVNACWIFLLVSYDSPLYPDPDLDDRRNKRHKTSASFLWSICEPPKGFSLYCASQDLCSTCAQLGSGRVCRRGDHAITSRRLQSYLSQALWNVPLRHDVSLAINCQGHMPCFIARTCLMRLLPQPVRRELKGASYFLQQGEQILQPPEFQASVGSAFPRNFAGAV